MPPKGGFNQGDRGRGWGGDSSNRGRGRGRGGGGFGESRGRGRGRGEGGHDGGDAYRGRGGQYGMHSRQSGPSQHGGAQDSQNGQIRLETQSPVGKLVYSDALLKCDTGRGTINPPHDPASYDKVKTNYLQIKKYPKALYEYTIIYGRIKFGRNSDEERGISRRDEKNSLLKAVRTRPELADIIWAHNFVSVFSLTQIGNGSEITFQDVEFEGKNGRREKMDRLGLRYTDRASLTKDGGQSNGQFNNSTDIESAERNRMVTGMNSIIAHKISDSPDSTIFQVGANRFFYTKGFSPLSQTIPPSLLTYRGYYFSVRPSLGGLFLNINTSVSAFWAPIRVSDMLQAFRGVADPPRVQGWMIGLRVRRIYDLPTKDKDDQINSEFKRSKIIAEFGLPPDQQNCNDGKDGTTTVKKYFQGSIAQLNCETTIDNADTSNRSKKLHHKVSRMGLRQCWLQSQRQ
jgi:hypothetical protein